MQTLLDTLNYTRPQTSTFISVVPSLCFTATVFCHGRRKRCTQISAERLTTPKTSRPDMGVSEI